MMLCVMWYKRCSRRQRGVNGDFRNLSGAQSFEGAHTLRENCNSPSAWNFPESQKSGTRGGQSSPSVALGEELHLGKMAFPECLKGHGTRGRPALGEGHLPREQHSGKTAHEKEKVHLTAALDGAV
jgi:hypothetical protein